MRILLIEDEKKTAAFLAKGLREAGWRPIALFASATVVNIVVALGLAAVLFNGFKVS